MDIDVSKSGKVMIVKPLGPRMDATMAMDFKQQMATWIQKQNRWFILDLSSVEFIDSSGLGAIISGLKLIGNNGSIVIANATGQVLELIRLTRLDKVFRLFGSQDEALNSLLAGEILES